MIILVQGGNLLGRRVRDTSHGKDDDNTSYFWRIKLALSGDVCRKSDGEHCLDRVNAGLARESRYLPSNLL